MKISTKGRYAVRMMLDLALHSDEGYISLKSVAARQHISDKYLEQIVISLNHAGFLKSSRGAQGGYALSRMPEQYTIGDILRVMEGSLAPVSCLAEGAAPCPRSEKCATLVIWKELKQAVDQVVDSYTLQDLMEIQRSISDEDTCL